MRRRSWCDIRCRWSCYVSSRLLNWKNKSENVGSDPEVGCLSRAACMHLIPGRCYWVNKNKWYFWTCEPKTHRLVDSCRWLISHFLVRVPQKWSESFSITLWWMIRELFIPNTWGSATLRCVQLIFFFPICSVLVSLTPSTWAESDWDLELPHLDSHLIYITFQGLVNEVVSPGTCWTMSSFI